MTFLEYQQEKAKNKFERNIWAKEPKLNRLEAIDQIVSDVAQDTGDKIKAEIKNTCETNDIEDVNFITIEGIIDSLLEKEAK